MENRNLKLGMQLYHFKSHRLRDYTEINVTFISGIIHNLAKPCVCLDFERLEQRLQSLQKDRLTQKHHLYGAKYGLFYCKDGSLCSNARSNQAQKYNKKLKQKSVKYFYLKIKYILAKIPK